MQHRPASRAPLPDGAGEVSGLRRRHLPLVAVVLAFGLANAAAYLAGVRPNTSAISGRPLGDMYQLLDLNLLGHHLISSVWHLGSQPPLFNLYAGMLVKMPGWLATTTFLISAWALGLVMVVCSYLLLTELGVPTRVSAVIVIVFIVASPAFLEYENWLSYAFPTATLMVLAAWSFIRYLRTTAARYALVVCGAISAVVLLNSTYQFVWMVVPLSLLLWARRTSWRRLLVVGIVPVAMVALWYAKDAAMFGTYTTSSWLGMNLARTTLVISPPRQIRRLERQGVLSPLASIPPFSPPGRYVPKYATLSHTGVPALDELAKSDGVTNFNNPLYVEVSKKYLAQDLAYMAAAPGDYASHVLIGAQLWFTPPDQYIRGGVNHATLAPYARFYDRFITWQPNYDQLPALYALYAGESPPPTKLSYFWMLTMAAALVGSPLLAWRRRRVDRPLAATMAFLWWSIGYAFVLTSLVEVGENERFAFELGPLPLLAAVAVVTAVASRWRRAAPCDSAQTTQEDGEVDPAEPGQAVFTHR